MRTACTVLVMAATLSTRTVQASAPPATLSFDRYGHFPATSGYVDVTGLSLAPKPGTADASSAAAAQAQPQSQAAPHRHTLRNILTVTIVLGVLFVVLGSAAKK